MSNVTAYVHASMKGAAAPAPSRKMASGSHKRSPSPVALGRSSFSSIRERDSDLAQTFTSTKISSYTSHDINHPVLDGTAIIDDVVVPIPAAAITTSARDNGVMPCHAAAPATAVAFPGDNCRDDCRDDMALSVARSLAWLRTGSPNQHVPDAIDTQDMDSSLVHADNADTAMEDVETVARQPFETLPLEIFRLIIEDLIVDTPPNGIDRRNVDLMSLLVTSKLVSAKTLDALYRNVIVPHSRTFLKFFTQLDAHPERGSWVRKLDFSHFNPVSLFDTASARAAARNLTAETLLRCLELTPSLREFLVQDYLDEDIDGKILQRLFFGLPRLVALDLCGCSSRSFCDAFAAVAAAAPPSTSVIQRLSMHKCTALAPAVFDFLLPKMGQLTHLDLAGTRVTDAALHSIPHTARITHLNLAKCTLLTPWGVVNFLANHPAVNQDSLVFLSLGFDASAFRLLDTDDVSRLLPVLPKTLKSLSLKGSNMTHTHLPQLREHAAHLEELALGRGLTLQDVGSLVMPPKTAAANGKTEPFHHELRYLDITDMDTEALNLTSLLVDGVVLGESSRPLEVVEVADDVFKRVAKSQNALKRMGWRQSEIGARSWLVRDSTPAPNGTKSINGIFAMENGQRPWKMGAQSWGMRKIPVVEAKVGGMYGSYMFGRRL